VPDNDFEEKDYYAILGVPRNASQEDLRRAYREAALRLHPDKNVAPGDTELFLETNRAYEVLIDPESRRKYDLELAEAEAAMVSKAAFLSRVIQSRQNLLQLDEPQVHYVLLEIRPSDSLPKARPPINLAVVIDRSTSMRGERLDRIRSAVLSILEDLQPMDAASVVAFSDRPEVVLSPEQAQDIKSARARLSLLQADGGTEIAQGLEAGLETLQTHLTREGVNQMVLFTDGRTYGDEDQCLDIAQRASRDGVSIHCVGIGSDWSDRLLDDLATQGGGSVVFMNTPRAVHDLLQEIFNALSQVVASRIRLDGSVGQQVDLRSSFRINPDPLPMGDDLPILLGNLPRDDAIRIVLEMVIHPIGDVTQITLAHLNIVGDLVGPGSETSTLPIRINIPVVQKPDPNPPPEEIVSALNLIALYRMQEQARHESELGQTSQAATRLEHLAQHLVAAGERDLAKAALNEAVRLGRTHRLSSEGEKVLKYGTRALLLPPARKESP
jgi:Ca-activated chloride channel family protein